MKNIFFLACFGLLGASCGSKEQRLTNGLEGDWKITSFKTDNADVAAADYEGVSFNFQPCKVKDYDFCDGIYSRTDPNGSFTIDFSYQISSTGEGFNFDFVSPDMADISGKVEKNSRKKFTFSYTDGQGKSNVFVLEPK